MCVHEERKQIWKMLSVGVNISEEGIWGSLYSFFNFSAGLDFFQIKMSGGGRGGILYFKNYLQGCNSPQVHLEKIKSSIRASLTRRRCHPALFYKISFPAQFLWPQSQPRKPSAAQWFLEVLGGEEVGTHHPPEEQNEEKVRTLCWNCHQPDYASSLWKQFMRDQWESEHPTPPAALPSPLPNG